MIPAEGTAGPAARASPAHALSAPPPPAPSALPPDPCGRLASGAGLPWACFLRLPAHSASGRTQWPTGAGRGARLGACLPTLARPQLCQWLLPCAQGHSPCQVASPSCRSRQPSNATARSGAPAAPRELSARPARAPHLPTSSRTVLVQPFECALCVLAGPRVARPVPGAVGVAGVRDKAYWLGQGGDGGGNGHTSSVGEVSGEC